MHLLLLDYYNLQFLQHMVKRPHLSLGHNQSEDRVRSGALVIHSCSCRSSLLVAQFQPPLEHKNVQCN